MEPNEPYEAEAPNNPDEEQPASHKKKKIITALIITLVLVLLAIATAVAFTRVATRKQATFTPDKDTLVIRPGYTNLSEDIADPLALVQKESENIVAYQKEPVIDACDLLPLNAIREEKLLIAPSMDAGGMSRHYFDGGSQTIDKNWQEAPELTRDLNDCSIPLSDSEGTKNGTLYVEVFQPTYYSAVGMRSTIDDYLRTDAINDVEVFERTSTPIQDERSFYFLHKDNVYVALEFNTGNEASETVIRGLLETAAERLNQRIKEPRGAADFGYESSTFSGEYATACELSKAEDVETLFKAKASPSVQERIATSTGIIKNDNKLSNLINNHCVRRTTEDNAGAKTLTLEAGSYENEQAAKSVMAAHGEERSDKTKVKVGSEAFFSASGLPSNALFVRSGNTVLVLSGYDPVAKDIKAEEQIKKITAVIEAILQRLTGEEPSDDITQEKPAAKPESGTPTAE